MTPELADPCRAPRVRTTTRILFIADRRAARWRASIDIRPVGEVDLQRRHRRRLLLAEIERVTVSLAASVQVKAHPLWSHGFQRRRVAPDVRPHHLVVELVLKNRGSGAAFEDVIEPLVAQGT